MLTIAPNTHAEHCSLIGVTRRLKESERRLVQSGSVFVFDEHESGIKRWTDGLIWSPSRILGNFLIYRETHKPKRNATAFVNQQQSYSLESFNYDPNNQNSSDDENESEKAKERSLVGSLTKSDMFKSNGLVKKVSNLVYLKFISPCLTKNPRLCLLVLTVPRSI